MGTCSSKETTQSISEGSLSEEKTERRLKPACSDDGLYDLSLASSPILHGTKHYKQRSGVTGLANLGNTCFMNSAIQCLVATAPLSGYFLVCDWKKELNRNNNLGTHGELTIAYSRLLEMMWTGTAREVAPYEFKKKIIKFAPHFQGHEQHDSHELLSVILDGLHEDLNRVIHKPYVENIEGGDGKNDEDVAAEAWRNYLLRGKSIIIDIFQGQLKSKLMCLACGNTSVKFDPFMYLSLPIEQHRNGYTTLERCLEFFVAEELLEGDERWYCGKCKTLQRSKKGFALWKLPPRFKSNATFREKIRDPVKFPELLDLSKHLSSKQKCDPLYHLYAISNHHGGLQSGHYTAMAKNDLSQEWYLYDDASIKKCSISQMDTASAYVLFYSRKTLRGPLSDAVRRQSLSMPYNWPHSPSSTSKFLSPPRTDEKDSHKNKTSPPCTERKG